MFSTILTLRIGCFAFIQKSIATLSSPLCQLQVWTSTLSSAVKLTTRRASPPPEKQMSTSKVKRGLLGLLDIPRDFHALQADHAPPFKGVNKGFNVVL